ncbi:MAG TPA: hypothetical protein DCS29_00510 [Candidatus Magasanikbacteria bacterium]|nr:hypothetical protein [Candidatus Magasanikbacteria bacterium]
MNQYLKWDEQTITDFSDNTINRLYHDGYVFTRKEKGVMNQTRSVRIDLNKFKLSSENRRILRKTKDLVLSDKQLPTNNYHWSIGKMAKDFYTTKFGDGTFSANKVKELLTTEYNFNTLFSYSLGSETIGYAICYENNNILHYSYPFYDLLPKTYNLIPNLGMSMMLHTILYAQENNKKYMYLGSASRPTDVYKLQFAGLEWFDGKVWQTDIEELKNILKPTNINI